MKTTIFTISIVIALFLTVLPAAAQEQNQTDGCISEYAAEVDYFPQKVEVLEAANFSVEYFKHYKVVSVANAYEDAPPFEYVLWQCGAPQPPAADFAADAQFIEVPAGQLITLSTTQLPALAELGLLDKLIGVDSGFYISNPEALAMIADGAVAEVGFGADINIEKVLELAPSIVMSYGYNPATDAHPVLLEAGIFTALDASWREASPLGRAEWLKFSALFYNAEAEAQAIYDDIATQYQAARDLTADLPAAERPTVLLNSFLSYADAWYIPGAATYVGHLIRDAGGDLLLAEEDSGESQALSFEIVYEGGLAADIWLLETFGVYSQADLLALDSRFGDFAAFQAGAVWNNNRDENPNGGNNYYELGAANPQLVLADLVALLHPTLLPEHEFAFYHHLPSE